MALELLSSSHVETRVSAIKLLSLMLVSQGFAQTAGWVLRLSSHPLSRQSLVLMRNIFTCTAASLWTWGS